MATLSALGDDTMHLVVTAVLCDELSSQVSSCKSVMNMMSCHKQGATVLAQMHSVVTALESRRLLVERARGLEVHLAKRRASKQLFATVGQLQLPLPTGLTLAALCVHSGFPLCAAVEAAVLQRDHVVLRALLDARWGHRVCLELDECGDSPLHFASADGDAVALGLLLASVRPDRSCPSLWMPPAGLFAGQLPHHVAASAGHDECLRSLCESQSIAFTVDRSTGPTTRMPGATALMLAAEGGRLGCLRTLLRHGADPMLTNALGERAIDFAAQRHDPACARALLDAMPAGVLSSPGEDLPLFRAILHDALGCVSLFLERGASLFSFRSTRTIVGTPDASLLGILGGLVNPPMLAAYYGRTECLRIMIQHDTNGVVPHAGVVWPSPPSYCFFDPSTTDCALSVSACMGHVESFELLLSSGKSDVTWWTEGAHALAGACAHGHLACADLVLRHRGPPPNTRSAVTMMLYTACEAGNADAVEWLLRELDGRKYACHRVHTADNNTPLHAASRRHRAQDASASSALGLLLGRPGSNAVHVNVKNDSGETPLHLATRSGGIVEMRQLLGASADPNRASLDGTTPLMEACRNRDAGAVRVLLDAGADATATNCDGNTALMELVHAPWSPPMESEHVQRKMVQIASALFDQSPRLDVNMVNHLGDTVRHIAAGKFVTFNSPIFRYLSARIGARSDLKDACGRTADEYEIMKLSKRRRASPSPARPKTRNKHR